MQLNARLRDSAPANLFNSSNSNLGSPGWAALSFVYDELSISPGCFPPPSPASMPPAFNGPPKVPKASRGKNGGRRPRAHAARILVVDDVLDVTEMIALLLKHAGFEVATADSAEAALEMARVEVFDLVISDIGMPKMNGYELAEALQALPNYGNVPIIAVTGFTEYDDRSRAIEAGFSNLLTKPLDPAGLLNLIKELLP